MAEDEAAIQANAERIAVEITRELFPGPLSIEDAVDPEDPSFQLRVIVVNAKGDIHELSARTSAWHDRMIEQLGKAGSNISICVVPE